MGEYASVRVKLERDAYDIVIGSGLLERVGELYPPRPGQRASVITSEPLVDLLAEPLLDGLERAGWQLELSRVADGEGAKSLQSVEQLCREMSRCRLDRGSVVFALGGGVVGDLAGFVAAIYMRGIDFVQVPTTLLAQVDASVGGKVAVDLPEGKNLVGAFHQPRAVFIDTDALSTLPARQVRSGMAEVIKHAAIADERLFGFLETHLDAILALDGEKLKHILQRNCQIKADIVSVDPHESGLRAVLNAGHTIGHALEAAAEWRMSHGEGVALGLVAETRLAVELGRCEEVHAARIEALVNRAGLGITRDEVDPLAAREALRRDKKIRDGVLRLPLITAIGHVELFDNVPPTVAESVLDGVLRPER